MKVKEKILSGNECLYLHLELDRNSSGQVADAGDARADVLLCLWYFYVEK